MSADNAGQVVASAPPADQPVIVQQVFVVQQPGTQPVYVGDQVVQPGQQIQYPPSVYNQQQPLIQPQVVHQQPQQQFEQEPTKRKRHVSNGDPKCVTWCCNGCSGCGDATECFCCLCCCPFYMLYYMCKSFFD